MATPTAAAAAAIYCIGCGDDISESSKTRRKLGPDSTSDPMSREQALLGWKYLFKKQLQQQRISEEEVPLNFDDPGKICKHCFNEFRKFNNLQVQLENGLLTAMQQMKLRSNVSSSSDYSPPHVSQCKRRCSHPPASVLDSGSPSVMVRNNGYTFFFKVILSFIASDQHWIQEYCQELHDTYT